MYIPVTECVKRKVYRIDSRNLLYGVYDGNFGFIGIRSKFGVRYLFTEYHHDQGPPFGTVRPLEDLNIVLPDEIVLSEGLGSVDRNTGKDIFYTPKPEGVDELSYGNGWGWAFVEDGKFSKDIYPMRLNNDPLEIFMEEINAKESKTDNRSPRL